MDSNVKRRFRATINGKNYTLLGKATPAHMQAVTELLNEQFDQIKKSMPNSTEEQQAILIAFNAVSNQLKLEAQLNRKSSTRIKK